MSTFASTADFQISRDELISASLRTIGVLNAGDSPTSEDLLNCAESLNLIVKDLQVQGLRLWTTKVRTIPMNQGQTEYTIGPDGGVVLSVEITNGGTGFTSAPTVTFTGGGGAGAAGTAIITGGQVTAVTVTAGGSGYSSRPTIVFTGGGGSGAAALALLNGIFAIKPLRTLTSVNQFVEQMTNVTLHQYSQDEYFTLGQRTNTGVPHSYWPDWQVDNLVISMYNVPDSSILYQEIFTFQQSMADINLATENVEVPREWLRTFKWLLAQELALEYGASPEILGYIDNKAGMAFAALNSWDSVQEDTPIRFSATGRYQGRGQY